MFPIKTFIFARDYYLGNTSHRSLASVGPDLRTQSKMMDICSMACISLSGSWMPPLGVSMLMWESDVELYMQAKNNWMAGIT